MGWFPFWGTVDWKHQSFPWKFSFEKFSHMFFGVREMVSGGLKLTVLHSSVFSETVVKAEPALAVPAALSSTESCCSTDLAAQCSSVMLWARWLGKWLALAPSRGSCSFCSAQTGLLDVMALGAQRTWGKVSWLLTWPTKHCHTLRGFVNSSPHPAIGARWMRTEQGGQRGVV